MIHMELPDKLRRLGVPEKNVRPILRNRLALEEISLRMREHAVSWRGCLSGGACIAWGKNSKIIFLASANHKPHEGERRHLCGDYCSEHEITWGAENWECSEVIAKVIRVDRQPDDKSSQDYGVTISCYYCRIDYRWKLRLKEHPVKDHTVLLFVDPLDPERRFLTTVGRLLPAFPDDPPFSLLGRSGK